MKRLIFAILCVFGIVTMVFAQARLGDFVMRGAASQVMTAEGLVGAHPSLPLNSMIKITNPTINKTSLETHGESPVRIISPPPKNVKNHASPQGRRTTLRQRRAVIMIIQTSSAAS